MFLINSQLKIVFHTIFRKKRKEVLDHIIGKLLLGDHVIEFEKIIYMAMFDYFYLIVCLLPILKMFCEDIILILISLVI